MISSYVISFGKWGVRKIGVGAFFASILLGISLGSVTIGLNQIADIPEDVSLFSISMLALLAGWQAARIRIPGWITLFILAAMGAAASLVHTGHMANDLARLLEELFSQTVRLLQWYPGTPLPDTRQLGILLSDIAYTTYGMLAHLQTWFRALAGGVSAYNPVAAALVWSMVVWCISGWAAWATRRIHKPLEGVLPALLLLAAGQSYSRTEIWYLLSALGG